MKALRTGTLLLLALALSCTKKESSNKSNESAQPPVAEPKSAGVDTLDPEAKAWGDRWIQSQTSEDIAKIITELANIDPAELAKRSPAMQYLASMAIPLSTMRGLVYRQIPIVDQSTSSRVRVLQLLRNFAGRFGIFFPDMTQQKALFHYMVDPYIDANGQAVAQFKSENELRDYLLSNVAPAFKMSINIMNSISNATFGWDNRIWFGNQEFKADVLSVKTITPVEIEAHMARAERSLYLMKFAGAYSWNGYMGLSVSIRSKFGVDLASTELRSMVDDVLGKDKDTAPAGLTRKDRAKLVRAYVERRGNKLFGLEKPALVEEAFGHFKKSADHAEMAWNKMLPKLSTERSRAAVIDPSFARLNDTEIKAGLDNVKKLLAGPADVYSILSGKGVRVDVPGFFKNPPRNLSQLLPVEFNEEGGEFLKLGSTNVMYRNYFWGTPNGWDAQVYRPLFPTIANNKDVDEALRIFTEVRGSGAFVNTLNIAFR
jgi:hypothetical protein